MLVCMIYSIVILDNFLVDGVRVSAELNIDNIKLQLCAN